MSYLQLYNELIAMDNLQFIEKVQTVPMRSDECSIALWNALLCEMNKRRHDMYKKRDLCKSGDVYKNNDLIDRYEQIEDNTFIKLNKISNRSKGKKEKQNLDAEYLKIIDESIKEICKQYEHSFWKVVDGDFHEIDSTEYDELIKSGEFIVFKCP